MLHIPVIKANTAKDKHIINLIDRMRGAIAAFSKIERGDENPHEIARKAIAELLS